MKILISSRELEVLRKSVDGLSAKQIASDLNTNHHDITRCQRTILQKTNADNAMGAIQILAKNGFVLTNE